MKYAVIKVINGNFFIHAEGFASVDKALISYHQLCASLWNASDVTKATVIIVDEELNPVGFYRETITHAAE